MHACFWLSFLNETYVKTGLQMFPSNKIDRTVGATAPRQLGAAARRQRRLRSAVGEEPFSALQQRPPRRSSVLHSYTNTPHGVERQG